ncbi:MAG TPA: DUF898 family protein [Alphaproteobacteria bacterium]|nr:DUF898 family protein [Alphaproteobacteria bacterium]
MTFPQSPIAPGPSDPGHADRLRYDGTTGGVARIAIRNGLLILLTLTLYRFWAVTRLRRYLWSRTAFEGERFEYLGNGRELFIGFLVALVVLVPLLIAQSVLSTVFQNDIFWNTVVQAVYLLIIFWLIGYARWRASRYRLRRTAWRGIRFDLEGSAARYANMSLGFTLLNLLTLGLVKPVADVRLWGYWFRQLRFGTEPFGFTRASGLMRPWLAAWFTGLIATLLFYGALVAVAVYAASKGDLPTTRFGDWPLWIAIGVGIAVLPALILNAYFTSRYYAALMRRMLAGLRFGAVEFSSTLLGGELFRTLAVYLLATTLILFGFVAAFAVAAAIGGILGVLLGAAFYIVTTTLFFALPSILFIHPLIRLLTSRTLVVGELDAVRIGQSAAPEPGRGEGLEGLLDAGVV